MELSPLLEIRNLSITYHSPSETIRAVRNISLKIHESETLALVGETGSGKSSLALAILGLLDPPARVEAASLLFEQMNLRDVSQRDWRKIRGQKIGMVFQDARNALNPVLSVRDHLIETLRTNPALSRKNAASRASELLREVGIAKEMEALYPFELSGGTCQRVGIALAICNHPRLLIADEPTSAIDSTSQAQILDLLQQMKERHGLSLLIISHDLPMIAQIADHISIMYHGSIVESGTKDEVFGSPEHPYTRGLIQSQPGFQHHCVANPLRSIPGAAPIPGESSEGCAFAPRCTYVESWCRESVPAEQQLHGTHRTACFRAIRQSLREDSFLEASAKVVP